MKTLSGKDCLYRSPITCLLDGVRVAAAARLGLCTYGG